MTYTTDTDHAVQVDWTIVRGKTFLKEFNIKEDGALVDLTGSTFRMVLTNNRGVVVDEWILGDGISVVSTGRLRITDTAAHTATWPAIGLLTFFLEWTRPTTPVVVKDIIVGKI